MASARTLARLDTWAWILIFVGMVTATLGIATGAGHPAGWPLGIAGALAIAAGIACIVVRARLPEGGAQSSATSTHHKP